MWSAVSKRQDFKSRVASALAEGADHREHGRDEFGHEFALVTRRDVELPTQSRGIQALDSTAPRGSVNRSFSILQTCESCDETGTREATCNRQEDNAAFKDLAPR